MNARRILSSVLALFLLTGITVHISVVAQSSSDSGGSTSQRLDYTDIGATELDGGYEIVGSEVTIEASGRDIWGQADGFGFAYRKWEGDGEIVARVTGLEDTHEWAKAGVMIRSELTEGSTHAMAALSPRKGIAFLRRQQSGGPTKDDAHHAMRVIEEGGRVSYQQRGYQPKGPDRVNDVSKAVTEVNAPAWVKLVRDGDVIKA